MAVELILRIALTLLIGVVSGVVAKTVGMPLPWMLGPMIGTTVVAAAGFDLRFPAKLLYVAFPVVGVMLGSRITSEMMAQAPQWITTFVLLVPFVVAACGLSYVFYRKIGGFDAATAYYSAMPGGLNDMVILGGAAGGDERRIALAHAARILCVIGFVALFFGAVLGVRSSSAPGQWLAVTQIDWHDAAWLAGAAVLGLPLGKVLRLPAPYMLGPMIVSAVVHVAGFVSIPPPDLLVIGAQVVLGVRIGVRFRGVPVRDIVRDLRLGAVSSIMMIAVALGFAWVNAILSDIELSQAFLAFSPGGFVEMSLLALAMGQEVAYVSISHVLRIMLVIFGAPIAARVIRIGNGSQSK